MSIQEFILRSVLALSRLLLDDDAASARRPPNAVCAELENTRQIRRAACTFTDGDGADVTVYVFVDRTNARRP